MSNLFTLFQRGFPADQQAFIHSPDGTVLSYGDVRSLSGQLAQYFTSLGLQPGDRIAVQVAKSPMALMLYLAALRAGLIYLPLNTAYTDAEMAYFMADAQPSLLVCEPQRQAALQNLLAKLDGEAAAAPLVRVLDEHGQADWLAQLSKYAAEFEDVSRESDDIAAILYTSGTTGQPKGAMLSHGNLAANAYTLTSLWGFTGDDVLLHALPIFHVHGLFVACHCVLAAGASMQFLPSFELPAVMAALPQATVMMGVPTFYTRLLAAPQFSAQHCANMRLFISGSAPLLASTHQQFATLTGHKILERYGMTETGMLVSNPLQGERRAGTVGQPLPQVLVRIVNEQNQPLALGEIGSIQVQGPNVFKGYWRKPEKTAQDFTADGFFITGDQGSITDDGYISIVGRAKDMVISGGYNVYPKEVELVLDAIAGVKESAVIGLPHSDLGEAVTAIVVAETELSEAALIAQAKQKLAAYKVPKQIFFVAALPRNTMAKVQKNQLRAQYAKAV
ncbi:malonyl-CoA synthase [Dasania sp. GY-MA-18]|uniref:Malonyl-CoA synthase n=1 Tax=Dasania phycosphaerae TaxID=2950436 RepID=A0A9J6RI50_9GAMM|nr:MULTISPECIES: malonyl-CoA synthase [Dasania]MCR8921459.1 malonyl-CoA synthase [Dasania sp. GY-MA-18]MCZ0863887.1 malonyl-CoA synthase [Dasania phycosphaerae]MCZ0867615.1 malonyl-CoA synthase [Dasania phycosphaerae]